MLIAGRNLAENRLKEKSKLGLKAGVEVAPFQDTYIFTAPA
jgi:hypothetical protein